MFLEADRYWTMELMSICNTGRYFTVYLKLHQCIETAHFTITILGNNINQPLYCPEISKNSPPRKPYRGLETPGPLRRGRREYLWISVPPRRPRSVWQAVQRCWSKGAETKQSQCGFGDCDQDFVIQIYLLCLQLMALTVAVVLCCRLAPNVPSIQSFRPGMIIPLSLYLHCVKQKTECVNSQLKKKKSTKLHV